MKRILLLAAALAALCLAGCQSGLSPASSGTAATADPIGGLTVRVAVGGSSKGLSKDITGVTTMVVTLESTEFPSLVATATESGGAFTAQIASVKPGEWTVKVSLFDSTNIEKYYGQSDTIIKSDAANAVSVEVAATGSADVTVTEDPNGPRVLPPSISPAVTDMYEVFNAILSSATPGAAIRYTLDGTDPTASSGMLYTGPISINKGVTLKAIALKDGLEASHVATQAYSMIIPPITLTIDSTNSIKATDGTSYYNFAFQVGAPAWNPGVSYSLYYTTDGTDPSSTNGNSTDSNHTRFALYPSTSIKAVAYADGWVSAIASVTIATVQAPGGGIVYYDKGSFSDGWRYLEAAPSDMTSTYGWCNSTQAYTATGATGTAIGTGRTNTSASITALGTVAFAAEACVSASYGGLSDWFLPSLDELWTLYSKVSKTSLSDLASFTGYEYWSSTEDTGSNEAELLEFNGAWDYNNNGKWQTHYVRAIREF